MDAIAMIDPLYYNKAAWRMVWIRLLGLRHAGGLTKAHVGEIMHDIKPDLKPNVPKHPVTPDLKDVKEEQAAMDKDIEKQQPPDLSMKLADVLDYKAPATTTATY